MSVKSVLFLHGFNSHPRTFKALVTQEACRELAHPPEFSAPVLSSSPMQALAQAEAALRALTPPTLVIGSSLGGFLALCLAERHPLSAIVLLNPALDPLRFVQSHMGERFDNPVTGEQIEITPAMQQELHALSLKPPRHPERIMALLGGRDEVIDHRHTRQWLANCTLMDCPDDDHALLSYPEYVARVLAYGGLNVASAAAV
ncbi:YqiA/YcfP family alpha/beta fold hydrolase [Zymobacter sp. IVIA_5232.4 C2]|uniref:YqiA/YcfP family alpha/beta fold hydrolase n=1 Tax=Zymobacter sp. IVIA_5232.4 C2 TaxID=3394855 RepID=UPI0039C24516